MRFGRFFGREKSSEQPFGGADPEFLGDFLVAQFFPDMRFKISEEEFADLAKTLDPRLESLAQIWILTFLAWVMRRLAKLI
jgi:hypothetical protein